MHLFRQGRSLIPLCAALSAVTLLAAPRLLADEQDTRTVYLSVTDGQGLPVTDLRQDEIFVREGGEGMEPTVREVVTVRKATQPLAVMLLADTSKATGSEGMSRRGQVSGSELVRDVRAAFSAFVKTMAAASPESEMELMEFGQAAVTITRMTSNVSELEKGIARLFPKNNMPAVLMEAIHESARTLAKVKTPRRAIVALNVLPTDEQSRQQPNQMLQQVRASNASVWAVSYNSGTVTQDPRGVVIDALAKQTGGWRETIASQSALELHMVNAAKALAEQYEVTFRRAPGGKQPQMIQFGVARQGLRLLHSIYAPQ